VYARVTIFDDVDLSLEREALAWAQTEGLRISKALPGYQGLLTLVDRADRRLVGIGFYATAEDARQVDSLFPETLAESLPEELRRALPTQSSVGVFEVVERDGL
jgi:hypothetical protein